MEIRNWNIDRSNYTKPVIVGEIYEDERGRFKDGEIIHTSSLVKIDFIEMKAYTKNSVYDLIDAMGGICK